MYVFIPPLTFSPFFSALLYLEQFQTWPAISSKKALNKLSEESCRLSLWNKPVWDSSVTFACINWTAVQ